MDENAHKNTMTAFLLMRILTIPFWVIFNMLPFILYKDLGGTPFQIALIFALKPMAALLSPYWSEPLEKGKEGPLSNLIWADLLKFTPFLLYPWMDNNWLFIATFGLYMIFTRGTVPAWMEIFKRNLKNESRTRIFATGSAIDYLGCGVLPFFLGPLLDYYPNSWRWIFFVTACIGLISTFFLTRIPTKNLNNQQEDSSCKDLLKQKLLNPWQRSFQLLKSRPDFFHFQVAFMLGGTGLMMLQTALPKFFIDILHLSYTEILTAITICKGIGLAISTPLWTYIFDRWNIYRFSSFVTILAAFCPLFLVCSVLQSGWLYVAFFLYGAMQGGSKLSWHLSGPIFAKDEASYAYSTTNVMMVGIRGSIAPLLGAALCTLTNSLTVLFIAFLFCLFATERLHYYSQLYFGKAKEVVS